MLNTDQALAALAGSPVEVKGRLPWSSNATLLVHVGGESDGGSGGSGSGGGVDSDVRADSVSPEPTGAAHLSGSTPAGVDAVYKFTRGERELWDFEPGLWKREVAAFELARALGWDMVPPTIGVQEAPFGEGSLQLFMDSDFTEHYFTLRDAGKYDAELRRIAVFDVLANNADRKSGHVLVGEDGRIWGIDHGLCFSPVHHLRTVMWDYAGDPLPAELRADLEKVCDPSALDPLRRWLTDDEVDSITWRARALLDDGEFPHPTHERQFPWPLV